VFPRTQIVFMGKRNVFSGGAELAEFLFSAPPREL
jgi:hypothetical protein